MLQMPQKLRWPRIERAGLTFLVLALLLLFAGCRAAPDAATEAARTSQFGTYTNEAAAIYDGFNRHSEYVPMPDGTRLAVDYYLPTRDGVEAEEPLPVILHYTRYIRAIEGEGGEVSGVGGRDPVLQHMLKHGYAVAVADARGTGASFGVHRGAFSVEETRDSYTLIEWLGSQPWSNGKVGMSGRSYPGMTQYQAATQGPPALKAIFAEMAGPSAYDFVYRGGTYKSDFVSVWGAATKAQDLGESGEPARVDADADGKLRDEAIDEHAANLWAHELLDRGERSDLRDFSYDKPDGTHWSWDTIATIDDTDAITASGVGIYHLVGWYDIYTTQQPWLYASLDGVRQKMMIGPWVHSGGYGGTVHKAEILRWYDYWLKGIDNGVMAEEPVHYYVMRGNHTLPADSAEKSFDENAAEEGAAWSATSAWPPAGVTRQQYVLAAGPSGSVESVNDGTLLAQAAGSAAAGKDDYRVDATSQMGSFSRWMNGYGARREEPQGTTFFDERTAEDRKGLTYTTEPLSDELVILGYPTVHLWVSSTKSDGDVFVYLEEIDAEGRSHYVSEGALRISHRALAEPPFDDLGLPYHRSLATDLAELPPGEPAELVFDLMGTAIVIDPGHRIRITVTGADARNYALYPDPSGGDMPTLSIHRGGEHASYIELPVRNGGET